MVGYQSVSNLPDGGKESDWTHRGACGQHVKRISPDTAIHEQYDYAKLLDHHKYNILMTNVDNDNSDKTYTNMHEV